MKSWTKLIFLLCAAPLQAAELAAVLQWEQRVEISTPVSGVVKTVNVSEGDRVKKGQILLQLDDAIFSSRVDEAGAAITRLKEEAAEAKRDMARVQELFDRGVNSSTELDQARLRQTSASGKLAEAQAQHRRETRHREDASLKAPFDAIVVSRLAQPGQVVAAGLKPQTLLIVAKSGEMLARAALPESQLGDIKVGQAATVSVGKQTFRGSIRSISLEPASRDKNGDAVYWMLAAFDPGETPLRSGMKATVEAQTLSPDRH
ncbi:MAG: efflux RND transporter periplasmic adaptor subunit [Sulfuricellaceae bacterium]|nr:efflux RND transporter periplasmic adaptor subunit [Sulfuricellaceae bacterium]